MVRGDFRRGCAVTATSYVDRSVEVRGLKLHYQEWGRKGNPVILALHGFGVSGHMFDEFAERAQDAWHIIALDQRGHGDSGWADDGDYSRSAFVEDIEAFRKALGLDRFVLMGHSMGGLNAVSYTAKYPEAVAALILVDVGPESAKEGVDNIVRFTRGPDELEFEQFVEMAHRFNPRRSIENIRERMRHRLKPSDEPGKWTWKFDRRFRQQDSGLRIGSELSNDEMWAVFQSLTGPTLIIRGAESDVLTQETAERAAREMQNARLVVIPGAGHSVPGDNPDAFTAAVREFLATLDAPGAGATVGGSPLEVADGPTLDELVETHAEAGRRRAPSLMIVVAAAAAFAALAVAVYVGSRRARRRPAKPAAEPESIPQDDVALAREHALELAQDLNRLARVGARRARRAAHQIEVAQARERAMEIARQLGEKSLAAERSVVSAVAPRGRQLVRRRPTKSAFGNLASTAKLMATMGMLLAGLQREEARRKPRRALPWRR